MIRSYSLENFKSYRHAKLILGPLTMLIGANASGKSNAIEGLRLLSWLAQGNKLSAIQYALQDSDQFVRGRVGDLGYQSGKNLLLRCEGPHDDWTPLTISLVIGEDGSLHIQGESIQCSHKGGAANAPLYEVKATADMRGSDIKVAYNNFARGGTKPQVTCSDQAAVFTQLDSPATFPAHHKDTKKTIPEVCQAYQRALGNILFLDPAPSAMRDYSFRNERSLLGSGKNLSSVLYHLWNSNDTANRATILKFISSLPEQDISTIDFLQGPRGEVMVSLVETFGGQNRKTEAALLSDGTLRVLAIAAAMLSAPEGGMVVIEEIDNGVHPSRASQLLEQINAIAEQRNLRILLSSHNPALLDALPVSAVPNVVFCYRDSGNGSSCLVRLQDLPDYPELMAQGRLGHLMTTGILERFVKFHPCSELKKKKAMAWLTELRTMTAGIQEGRENIEGHQ
ncbi:MAG: ATP-binding protein [Magnetococcus sp. WYHC-3]